MEETILRVDGFMVWVSRLIRVHFLEFKNSLAEGTWTSLQTVAGHGTVTTLVDPSATGARGLYRVRVE
jgi:hypothetical protein